MSTSPGRLLFLTLGLALLTGCETGAYYSQAVSGHLDLMGRRQSIQALLDDRQTPHTLRQRLQLAERIRAFAEQELGLSSADSYRQYADLERPYVAWNVFAAPEFSLEPVEWCFPISGCVSYRGYFSEAGARDYAAKLAAQGHDTFVGGVTAYSTLGWFDDPVLNTFFSGPPWTTAGLLFHELAHQKLYVAGDSTFNESFAVVVEREGVRRWLRASGQQEALMQAQRTWQGRDQRRARIVKASERLEDLYRQDWTKQRKREEKRHILDRLKAQLQARKTPIGAEAKPVKATTPMQINNALIAAIGTYHSYVPGFEAILAGVGGDLDAFYRRAQALATLPKEKRRARLFP